MLNIRIHTYLFIFFAVVTMAAFTACSSDDLGFDMPVAPIASDSVTVTLRLAVDAPAADGVTRADNDATVTPGTIPDAEAKAGEMMKSWIIIMTRDGKMVERVITSSFTDGERETDAYSTRLAEGSATFYAFANLTDEQKVSAGLLVLDGTTADETTGETTTKYRLLKAGDALPDFASKTLKVSGNQSDVSQINGGAGIPMSSEATTHTIASQATGGTFPSYTIQLVRMLSRVDVEVTNEAAVPLKVGALHLTDITKNPGTGDADNIFLLPGARSDADRRRANHLNGTPTTETYICDIPQGDAAQDNWTIPAKTTKTFSFYVNESRLPAVPSSTVQNPSFNLIVDGGDGEPDTNVSDKYVWPSSKQFSFYDFDRIARNEIHRLPVTLRGVELTFEVAAFTAIGVLPVYETRPDYDLINLGMYGEFHITPVLKEWATGYTMYVTNKNPYATQGGNFVRDSQHQGISNPLTGFGTPAGTLTEVVGSFDGDFATETGKPKAEFYTEVYSTNSVNKPTIELFAGNYTGSAIYNFATSFNYHSSQVTLSRKFKITNTKINFDDLAKWGWWHVR